MCPRNPRGGNVTRPLRLSCSLALLAAAASLASAAPPAPLPSFELTSLEGNVVAAEEAAPAGRWLLVYVSPHSGAARQLLRTLEGGPAPAPSLLVVVGSAPADAKALAAAFEGRLTAAWYADPGGAARRALGLRGVPVVLGLDDRAIRWTLSGGLSDPRTLRSILVSWR
jgi:hypothetical protein